MDKLIVSVFDNIFESESTPMSHIAIVGKKMSGKTELLMQLVGAFLKSGKKVIWFSSDEKDLSTIIKKWNGTIVNDTNEYQSSILENLFILINSKTIDFTQLKEDLISNEHEWILVHDNIEELISTYEKDKCNTEKLDFLYFISEFGNVFHLYSLVAGRDFNEITKTLPSKKIIDNSKNLLLLEQSHSSLKYAKNQQWIDRKQMDKMKKLPQYEAFYIRK